ncbi:MAG TPA: class I SAM-dependent methyltransferase [Gemmatimonadaceae bacterium]|nr:class I SAM-dependent methyltransferase [Gemmatimonadaceae bacterium]
MVAFPPARAWADIPREDVELLIETSRRVGWRAALEQLSVTTPFFRTRLRNVGLGNWHLLLLQPGAGRALDVGCGFGSLLLGLAEHFSSAVGVEMLPDRLRYAQLRATQEPWPRAHFARSSGLRLPFADETFDLVTMNGVLEWAALYDGGEPGAVQRCMLEEARRVGTSGGVVAVAIENRYALESLLGLPDTHTGLHFVTAMPRVLANLTSRLRTGERYSAYLYGRHGYHSLFSDAGFGTSAVLDLISSYNDYDFVVRTDDALSYRFLWKHNLVRSFFDLAGRARKTVARWQPGWLGRVGYAYLVVGGSTVTTALDGSHPFWEAVSQWGIDAGPARFACSGKDAGSVTLLTHDGIRILAAIQIGIDLKRPRHSSPDVPPLLVPHLSEFVLADCARFNGTDVHAYLPVRRARSKPGGLKRTA